MPVSFIESYISFTLSARGGFCSVFQNAVCQKQEPAWGAVYILAWKKRQAVHIIFWEVMKCHGKCKKWMCFYVLILEIKLGIIFAFLLKGLCRSLHPCVSYVTAATCFSLWSYANYLPQNQGTFSLFSIHRNPLGMKKPDILIPSFCFPNQK